MIVDMRVYTCHPGRMADWVALYEKEAWPVQKQYLGNCLGWYTSIEGQACIRSCIFGAMRARPTVNSAVRRWRRTRHGRASCKRRKSWARSCPRKTRS